MPTPIRGPRPLERSAPAAAPEDLAARRRRDDADLMERVATGDDAALGCLYDRHVGLLLALGRRLLRDPRDAEEVVQEVFVQVWNQATRYDRRRSSVSTWLVLITRSRAIDRLRSRRVKARTVATLERETSSPHESPRGSSVVLQSQRALRLHRELKGIPAEQRQVLEYAFYRDMTQSEIARDLDLPLGTVKTRTLLAMRKLRKALAQHRDDLL